MARKLDDVMATLPKDRKKRVEDRAMELATLKDLRHAAQQTLRAARSMPCPCCVGFPVQQCARP